ncbi:hypothetical protein DFQ26_002891 [Actinomortierella ambigua]|nr:hypothetical protein DFQ26_002891 [Actinomortierella ambigua]
MCGRTAQGLEPAQIREDLAKTLPKPPSTWIDEDKYRTSFNVAPTRYQPVVRADASTGEYVKWGLIPRTTKAMPDYKSVLKSINARDDSLFSGPTVKPMFSHSKNYKRCIVLAQGFFEWRRRGKERVPFYTKRRDGHLMLMAGIYDVATIQGFEEPLYSYATITTNASPQLDWLHDRMPVLISNNDHEAIRAWLDPKRKWDAQLEAMLKPCSEFLEVDNQNNDLDTKQQREYILETYQVSGDVNNIRFDKKEFIEPWNTKNNMKTLARFLMPTKTASSSTANDKESPSPFHSGVQTKKEDEAGDGEDDINHQLLEGEGDDVDEGDVGDDALGEDEMLLPSTPTKPAPAISGQVTDPSGGSGVGDESDMDISMVKDDPDVTMESITHHHDTDDDGGNDPELKRILELSRQEHETALSEAAAIVVATMEGKRKRTPEGHGTGQDDHEEDDFQRALEASRLQAIADGHDDESLEQPLSSTPSSLLLSSAPSTTSSQSAEPKPTEADNDQEELRRQEQEDLDRAIAASLSEASSTSVSPHPSSTMRNPFLVSSSISPTLSQQNDQNNSNHKKRRISLAGSGNRSVTGSPSAASVPATPPPGGAGPRTPRKMGGSKHPSTPGDASIPKITSFFRKAE